MCVLSLSTNLVCNFVGLQEIITTFTDRDRYIRVIIKGKRRKKDTWYNTVVIQMDDNDFAIGRDDDGIIYYDL